MPLRVIQHYSDWVCTAVMSNLDVVSDHITTIGDLRAVLDQFENTSDDDDGATTNDESVFERTPINDLEVVYETDEDEFS